MFFFLIRLRPPRLTRTYTLLPYKTLFRSRRRREQQHAWVFDRLVLGRDGCWSRERTERAPIGLHDVPEGLLPVAIIAGVLEPLRKLVGEKRLRRVRLEDAMQSLLRRSEERRVGKEWVRTCRSWGSPDH